MHLREWVASVRQDARYALRQVHHAPAFATAVAVTLALGIGANSAMFGVIDRLLLRPPAGVTHPERVSRLYFTRTYSWAGTITGASSSYGDYLALRDRLKDVDAIAVYGTYVASMGRGTNAKQVRRTLATPSLFPLLGIRATLGRFFVASEERIPMGDPVAVLSYGFWQREFGGDSRVLGRSIQLGARAYAIVGVAPREFTGVDLEATDVWVPFSAAASELGGDNWYRPGWWTGPNILVRVRPEVQRSLIASQATTTYRRTLDETERAAGQSTDSTARVLLGSIIAGRAPEGAREAGPRIAVWLSAMAVVVLLIACSNVVNLFLSRATARRREIAVRLALGASRARIVRQLTVDSAVLVALGGVLGLMVGVIGDALLKRLLVPAGAETGSFIDVRLLLFTVLVTATAALVTGILPALAASRMELTNWLKMAARDGGHRRSRTRDAMLVVQAALSVVLLVGAGLFVRSLRSVLSVDLGFDAPQMSIASVDFSNTAFTQPEIDAFYRNAAERLRRLPGVQSTALATSIPFWSSYGAHLVVPGRSRSPITKDGGPYLVQVTPDYFSTAGTRIIRGREFTDGDRDGAARVTIVSETMAKLVWPGEDAIGKCIKIGSDTTPCSNIVGIAHDARRQALESIPVMQYYVPLDQHQARKSDLSVLVHTTGEPDKLTGRVRQTMASIVPDLPFVDVRSLESLIDPRVRPWRIGAGVFAAFGLLALIIASVGLYGMISYEVGQRTHEFGIRLALGASREGILGLVLRRGVGLALVGTVAGAAIARAGAPWLEPLLFETRATDAGVFAFVVATLLFVAVLACIIPARQAALSDPASALRAE
jgi:predicted permease